MHRLLGAGIILLVVGTAGYLVGITMPYPGRAFSVTTVILGITLVAIRSYDETREVDE